MGGDPAQLDLVVAAILALACTRGLLIGLVRETASIAALAAACIVAKLYAGEAGDWLQEASGGRVGSLLAPWLAGAGLAAAALTATVIAGRALRRGARWAGLGWADRAGGALLGAAEGVLVTAIGLSLAGALLGRAHPLLATSRSFEALERFELARTDRAVDVAAPPRSEGSR